MGGKNKQRTKGNVRVSTNICKLTDVVQVTLSNKPEHKLITLATYQLRLRVTVFVVTHNYCFNHISVSHIVATLVAFVYSHTFLSHC